MKPRDLINSLIQEYLIEELTSIDFSFKSRTTEFVRKRGDFTQFLYFALSKWNESDKIVDFWTIWTVESKFYLKWHLSNWHSEPLNHIVASSYGQHLPNWDKSIDNGNQYELMNVELKKAFLNLKDNIIKVGIPFLNANSDWINIANKIVEEKRYGFFDKASDYYRISNYDNKADEILKIAINYFEKHNEKNEFDQQLKSLRMRLTNN